MAHPAPQSVFYGQGAQACSGGPGGKQEGLGAGVRFTDGATAEAAHAVGCGTTYPTAHDAND